MCVSVSGQKACDYSKVLAAIYFIFLSQTSPVTVRLQLSVEIYTQLLPKISIHYSENR